MCKRRLMLYFFPQILHMLTAEVLSINCMHNNILVHVSLMERSLFLCRRHLVFAGERPRRRGPEREQVGRERTPRGGEREGEKGIYYTEERKGRTHYRPDAFFSGQIQKR